MELSIRVQEPQELLMPGSSGLTSDASGSILRWPGIMKILNSAMLTNSG
ncbi:hypothetical protein KBZ18_15370 [Synechococcus sp. Cruz-9H2]|nr:MULTISPECIES: hypothetical protein [unclassified Synechococcus]MCP9820864.1 hypothetical protein [Synechococcus sp. Cruz-9H2]MCP9857269.1 hypothetical protein [Synechococcus sp. Cruz-9C9]MCP9864515.1 hypothetical protein [Synechococcus sp. Cruz-7E5]MCP9871784.1 hypothetical protein [Synechococcus sp. Cruz-7B9]